MCYFWPFLEKSINTSNPANEIFSPNFFSWKFSLIISLNVFNYFYRPEIVHTLAGLITIKQSNTYILYSIKVVLTNIRVQVTFQNQPLEFLSHVTSWSYRYMVHNCFSHQWKWQGATCDRIKKQIELFLHSHQKIKLQSCPILRILNADNLFCFVVQLWN